MSGPRFRLIGLDRRADARGELLVAELTQLVPFECRRLFMVHQVPPGAARGGHAHRACHQLLLAAHGRVTVDVDDGVHQASFVLDDPGQALYLPPLTWGVQRDYSADAALLVLASHAYDPADYIHDLAEFRAVIAGAA